MSYENPLSMSHTLPPITVGAAQTQSIKGPAGKRGIVRAVAASVSTTIVGAATKVEVGVAADLDKFMTLPLGAIVAPDGAGTDTQNRPDGKIIAEVGKDEEILVTHAAGTSGVYSTTVRVDWF